MLFGQPSHFIQAQAQGRFVYVLGALPSCCKNCVIKTSRGNPEAGLLHQQEISGFRDSVFALGEDGIGVDSRHEKIALLFRSPYNLGIDRISLTIPLKEVGHNREDS